jgi:hypothetical protein
MSTDPADVVVEEEEAPFWWDQLIGSIVFILPIALTLFGAAFLPRASLTDDGYPHTRAAQFEQVCQQIGDEPRKVTRRECSCMLDRLQADLAFERFDQEEMAILLREPSAEVEALIEPCLGT